MHTKCKQTARWTTHNRTLDKAEIHAEQHNGTLDKTKTQMNFGQHTTDCTMPTTEKHISVMYVQLYVNIGPVQLCANISPANELFFDCTSIIASSYPINQGMLL